MRDFDARILPLLAVCWVSEELHGKGMKRLIGENKRHPSLTDCVSLEFMKSEWLRDVFALDRHFSDAGFRMLAPRNREAEISLPLSARNAPGLLKSRRLRSSGASIAGSSGLQFYHILSLQSFWAFGYFELNTVAFIKRLESTALNGAVMDEDVISGIAADKTITFFVIKPLYCSLFFHLFS